ncbi:MAG: translocation/assembly module TamB domain-containing protein [Bacteroidota bacterium]
MFLFLFGFYFVLRSGAFQSWATNQIGGYLANKWKTVVRVEGVDIELWKKIVLEGVYIEDQKHDTLLYAEKLKADIGAFDSDSQKIFLSNVILQNATINIAKCKGDTALNFQFIIDEFASDDTISTDSTHWNIGIGGITLNNISFSYRIESDTSHTRGINFSDLHVHSLNGKFTGIKIDADTLDFTINSLLFSEESGFVLSELSASASISPTQMKLASLKLKTNESFLFADICFKYTNFDDFNHFADKIKMKAKLRIAKIEMSDIAYFSSALHGLHKTIYMQGDVSGKVSDLKGRKMFVRIGEETIYKGDFDITGLPEIDETFMLFSIKSFSTSKKDIENIPLPPFDKKNFIAVPANIGLLGKINFKGNFSGFYNDFVSYGNFSTALGNIYSDISLSQNAVTEMVNYHGKFKTDDFNIGKFLGNEKMFGRITLDADVDGKGLKAENMNTSVNGIVKSFQFNDYAYQNMKVEGKLARKIFNGKINIKDENMDLDFSGNVDFSKAPALMNFTADVAKANLSKLNFVKSNEYTDISVKVNVSGKGNNLDDLTGKMLLDNIIYKQGKEIFDFRNVQLSVDDDAGIKTVKLSSAIADAQLIGNFKSGNIPSSFSDFLNNFLPSLFAQTKNEKKYRQEFKYTVQLKNTDVVTRAFLPKIKITCPSSISGKFDGMKNDFSFNASFPLITINECKFKKCNMNASSENNALSFSTTFERFQVSDSIQFDNINFNSRACHDTIGFHLKWNNASQQYKGDVPGYIAFSEKPKIKFKFLPSEITIADSIWRINPDNELVMDSSFIAIRDLAFVCGKQQVRVEGNISKEKEERMYLILSSFALTNLNSLLKSTDIALYGTVNGNTSIANIYDKPIFGSNLDIQNMILNSEEIGSGPVICIYDSKRDVITLNGKLTKEKGDDIKFSGNYFPSKDTNSIAMEAEVHNFHLEFFEPFLKSDFTNIKGTANAVLKIEGTPKKPLLNGIIHTNLKNIHVNYLGTDYHFNGDIFVEPSSFDFRNISIYDANQNTANIINGKLFHNSFRNLQFDVDLNTNKFLCLNTNEKDNPVYYGKVFATGIINIFGFLDNINISAAAKTDKVKNIFNKTEYTQLFIPLSESGEMSENSFMTFVKNDTEKVKTKKYKVNTTGITMNMKVESTSDMHVQLIFDEKVGDVIKARGAGNIEMTINEFGDFKIFGNYTIEDGDYLFTLRNVVNKKFKIENGGTIQWAGNSEDADIKMNAIYELRTVLNPLFPDDSTNIYKKRLPVNCVMDLSGKLMRPDVNFDIDIPTADDFTRQRVRDKLRNNENEMNKQVFFLLMTNSFMPIDPMKNNPSGSKADIITTTEMLSNQFSNWFSQISNEFDVGVRYRPGDEISKDEIQLALSTQLFNDKLSIDGSVANNTNTTTSQNAASIVGDVNVEYKITKDGKVRIKAFNKTNEGDILNTVKGPYTQGVGIFYKEEFNTLGELYKRFSAKFKKK